MCRLWCWKHSGADVLVRHAQTTLRNGPVLNILAKSAIMWLSGYKVNIFEPALLRSSCWTDIYLGMFVWLNTCLLLVRNQGTLNRIHSMDKKDQAGCSTHKEWRWKNILSGFSRTIAFSLLARLCKDVGVYLWGCFDILQRQLKLLHSKLSQAGTLFCAHDLGSC